MFLQNLFKTRVVQVLIVLQKDQTQIEFAEGQLEFLNLSLRQIQPIGVHLLAVILHFDGGRLEQVQFALQRGKLTHGFGEFFYKQKKKPGQRADRTNENGRRTYPSRRR